MNDFSDVVLRHLRENYYSPGSQKRPFSSNNRPVLKMLLKAQEKIKKHKQLAREEIVALLNEQECDWTSYDNSHEKFIKYLYIQGGIKNDHLYERLMSIEKERLRMSLEMRKIVQFQYI